ncbi:MAG: dihydrolipoyl dehydrogenase [Melioribacteraceae bacterium]|nr:dihydrolipoyl dehydrogenase [Melioribacteraceae bacterium]
MSEKYDIAVLGGGPGGYVAAIRASQLGYKVAVIDKDNLGGVCLNWGCIPTKALLKSAEVYNTVKNHAKDFGIITENVDKDFSKIIKRSRNVSRKIVAGVEYLMKKNKIDRIKGFGKLVSKNQIDIIDENGTVTKNITTDRIIIATGARPKEVPNIPVDREFIITSKEAMNLPEQPEEIIVIGAGAIGVEFAYFYNTIGTKVTVVEMLPNVLPVEDSEISAELEKILKKQKINILTSTTVETAVVKDGKVHVAVIKDGEKQELVADKVLNSIGVTGNVEGIGLEELGVEIYKNSIKVDRNTYQTSIEGIYAIGDVAGPPWLAHVASAEAIHCVETIKGLDVKPIDYNSIPGCTYCQPQVASVGYTEANAIEAGYEVKIGRFPFSASGKSAAIGERDGFVKLVFDAKYGGLLGAHIIGSEATELIAELGLAKTHEATYESIIKTVHAHPTLSETIMEAAADANGEAIHI